MHYVSLFLFSHVVRRWEGGWSSIIQCGWFFPVVLKNYYYLNKHIAHCTLLLKQSLKRPGARSSCCLKGTVTRRAIQESVNFHLNVQFSFLLRFVLLFPTYVNSFFTMTWLIWSTNLHFIHIKGSGLAWPFLDYIGLLT